MILPIAQIGNSILRTVCDPIPDIQSETIQELLDNMIETLKSKGIGIAAPQVNYNGRLFLIWIKPSKTRPHLEDKGPQIIINPTITATSNNKVLGREGCLSIPKSETESQLFGKVPRYERLEASYYDRNGELRSKRFEGLEARAFQHEYDHIDGILFLDRMDDLSSLCSYEEYVKKIEEEKLIASHSNDQ